jgi:hypothetical protein
VREKETLNAIEAHLHMRTCAQEKQKPKKNNYTGANIRTVILMKTEETVLFLCIIFSKAASPIKDQLHF